MGTLRLALAMALILDEKYRDARLFYGNRLLRLMPSYILVTLLAMLTLFVFNASATATPELYAGTWQHPGRSFVALFENLCLVGRSCCSGSSSRSRHSDSPTRAVAGSASSAILSISRT